MRPRGIYRCVTWKNFLICFFTLIGTVYFIVPLLHYIMEYRTFGVPPETPQFGKSQPSDNSLKLIDRDPINSKNEVEKRKKTFTILFWGHGERMVRRFVRSYGTTNLDPFEDCQFKNCDYRTDDLKSLNQSDAIVVHLHRTRGPFDLPPYRRPDQRWLFFTDESPRNTFFLTKQYSMKDYNGLFNWSMTYRADSDVPVPYGRTVKLKNPETVKSIPDYYTRNDKGVAVMGSNCGGENNRWPYIHELQKHIPIDIYGGCGTLKCPGGFMKDCPRLKGYKFYLAFENCNCREYITEKLWWNAFAKESVPIVMGGAIEDYLKLCPPKSHIQVESFKDPADLAKYLHYLSKNRTAYNEYFAWKRKYKVLNEHGYFHSPSRHICHICEALNKAEVAETKVYNDLKGFWDPGSDCRKAKWNPK